MDSYIIALLAPWLDSARAANYFTVIYDTAWRRRGKRDTKAGFLSHWILAGIISGVPRISFFRKFKFN